MGGIDLAAIDHRRERGFCQAGADIGGNIVYGDRVGERTLAAVRQGDNRHGLFLSSVVATTKGHVITSKLLILLDFK
jgi:hypothetical protein